MSSVAAVRPMKGQAVKVLEGKYKGKKGWINLKRGKRGLTQQKYHLILEGEDGHEELTCLFQNRVALVKEDVEPQCIEEAVFDQHSDLDAMLHKLTRELAKFQLHNEASILHFTQIFQQKLKAAIKDHKELGNEATVRLVDFRDTSGLMARRAAADAVHEANVLTADEEEEEEELVDPDDEEEEELDGDDDGEEEEEEILEYYEDEEDDRMLQSVATSYHSSARSSRSSNTPSTLSDLHAAAQIGALEAMHADVESHLRSQSSNRPRRTATRRSQRELEDPYAQ